MKEQGKIPSFCNSSRLGPGEELIGRVYRCQLANAALAK
jgi:hypothetical protein